ncbi:MAG: hypothetical protein AAFX87_05480 [Bacteroidota bacterium]
MKTNLFASLRSIVIFTIAVSILASCQDGLEDVSIAPDPVNEEATYSFTDQEVNTMLSEQFGTTDLTFEEKSLFLARTIANLQSTKQNSQGQRVQGTCDELHTRVFLTAGVYHSGDWDFKTSTGSINSFVYVSNNKHLSDNQPVGVSVTTWSGPSSVFCETVDSKYIAPTTLNCGGDDIRAIANNQWHSGTSVQQANVRCDD